MVLFARPKLILMPLILLVCLLAAEARGGYVSLTFKDRVVVPGPEIKLGQILESIHDASPALEERLRGLVVDEAPSPGQTKTLRAEAIRKVLTSASLTDQIQARIPGEVVVEGATQKITPERIEALFRRVVMDRLPWRPDRVLIDQISAPGEIVLPTGRLEIETVAPASLKMPGRVAIKMNFQVEGQEAASVHVSGLVRFFDQSVVAARPLPRHHVLEPSDVKLALVELRRKPARLINDPAEVVGFRLTRGLRAGQTMTEDLLDQPPLVQRGDKVTLVAQKGRLTVSAPGVIQDRQAARGDQVRVRNLATQREVIGRLKDAQTVEVFF